jgi:anaerobic ribonucleoside-triphosphate reductase
MMQGKVTEFAKKRFEEGNTDVAQYLAQVKAQVASDLQKKSAAKTETEKKSKVTQKAATTVKAAVNAKNLVNNKQTEKEDKLKSQLHESVQGLLKLNKNSDSNRPAPASKVLINTKSKGADATDKRS